MQIDNIQSSMPDPLEREALRSRNQADKSGSVEATLKAEYQNIIQQALQFQDSRTERVQRMKQALQDGSLDSDQAIQNAAGRILRYGF